MQYQGRPNPQSAAQGQGLRFVQACPKMENYSPDQPLASPGQLEHNNMIATSLYQSHLR